MPSSTKQKPLIFFYFDLTFGGTVKCQRYFQLLNERSKVLDNPENTHFDIWHLSPPLTLVMMSYMTYMSNSNNIVWRLKSISCTAYLTKKSLWFPVFLKISRCWSKNTFQEIIVLLCGSKIFPWNFVFGTRSLNIVCFELKIVKLLCIKCTLN